MTTTHTDPLVAQAYRVGQLEGTLEIVLSYLVLGAPVPADTVERARALLAHPAGTGTAGGS